MSPYYTISSIVVSNDLAVFTKHLLCTVENVVKGDVIPCGLGASAVGNRIRYVAFMIEVKY